VEGGGGVGDAGESACHGLGCCAGRQLKGI
jgi:hypothetical protein